MDSNDPNYDEKLLEQYKISLPIMINFLIILKEKYRDIFMEWKNKNNKERENYIKKNKDSKMSVLEMIYRGYISRHPDINLYLESLERMGF